MTTAHAADAASIAAKRPAMAVHGTRIRHGIEMGVLKKKQAAEEAERQRLINIRKDKQDEQKYWEVETERLEQAAEDTKVAMVEREKELEKKRELDRIAAEDMKMAARKDGLSGLFDIMAREWGRERSEL